MLENKEICQIDIYINIQRVFAGEYYDIYKKYVNIYEKYESLKLEGGSDLREISLLKFQVKEIEEAGISEEEEKNIEEEYTKISNYEKIAENIAKAKINMSDTMESLALAMKNVEELNNYSDDLKEEYEVIKNSYYELEEVAITISKMGDGEYDEKRLRKLESRIDEYVTLKRKYGKTVKDIFKFLAETKERLDEIEHKDERLEELSKEKQKLEQELDILAERMFQLRKKAGKDISDKINEGLKDLEMKNAEFSILVEKRDKFTKEGKDYIEFMIRTNKGEEQKELKKIASGGEMSRIMLSIKNILRRSR